MVTDLLAGIPVDDYETARAWYEIFAGRPPDAEPAADEAIWRLAGTHGIHVFRDDARAGSALVTLVVDSLERFVGFIAMRGIAPDSIDVVPGAGRTATLADPAGNTFKLREQSVAGDAPGG